MDRLAIIGCGDLGYQIAYHAFSDGHYQPVGFFDDYKKESSNPELPIFGVVDDVQFYFEKGKFDLLMIGLGYKQIENRSRLFERYNDKIPFGTIIHSSSFVDKSCTIGTGSFIYPNCTLDMNVVIRSNVILNVGCVIAHDSVIGQNSIISPSVSIAGFVDIGRNVNLGIGTIVIDNIKIVDNVKTGGGTVVIKDLDLSGLYVGVPAVFKKTLLI